MRVLAVSGSLRHDSHNTRLFRAAQQLPPGVELELYDGLKQIPPFDEDNEVTPCPEMGASESRFGALWAQAELRKLHSSSGARVLDAELAIATAHEAFEGDALIEAGLSDALGAIVEDLVDLASGRSDSALVTA